MRSEITPIGPFSLEAAAGFGFGPNEGRPPPFDGAMRLAFALDGGSGYAGVVLRQPEIDGPVGLEVELRGGGELDLAVAQVARVLSLDGDGEAFLRVGERDSHLAPLLAAHPGQRPVLFHSPYEGAAWSIISARQYTAARVRDQLAAELGETFSLDGRTLHAFPQPERLTELAGFPGLSDAKVGRLRDLAVAAVNGDFDVARLQALGPERMYEEVQQLNGIGPFYAGLITLRATGFADAVLLMPEPKVFAHAARLYGLPGPPTLAEFTELAEAWRPFRTWATVLIRLAGERGTY